VRRSKLMGKGTVSVDGTTLLLNGRKMLPLWARLVVILGAVAASLALLGLVAWPVAFVILFCARLRHAESVPAADLRSVTYEPRRNRLLITTGAPVRCVAWQTLGDSPAPAEALRRLVPDAFREEPVGGWKTF